MYNNKNLYLKNLVNYCKYNNIAFEATLTNYGGRVKTSEFNLAFLNSINKKYLGLANSIKAKLKKLVNIDNLSILDKFLKIENYHIYKQKNALCAYEYDLNNAYYCMFMFIYSQFKNDIEKILELKKKNKEVAMHLFASIFLSSKIKVKVNENAKEISRSFEINKLSTIFLLLRYLIIRSLRSLIAKEYRNIAISHFVDATILTEQINTSLFIEIFNYMIYKTFEELDLKLKKYHKTDICQLLTIDYKNLTYNDNTFSLKEKYITSIIYKRNELTNKLELTFYRDNKKVTYK